MDKKGIKPAAPIEERKSALKQAEEDFERSQKDSILKGKMITASQTMINKENRSENIKERGDIFGEEDIVSLPSSTGNSGTFH